MVARYAKILSIAVLALLVAAACSPEHAERKRLSRLERDPVPLLYQGALTVHMADGTIVTSDRGYRRIDWSYSSGQAHAIDDPVRGVVFSWTEFGPGAFVVSTRRMAPETSATLQRWRGRRVARSLGRCGAAGEQGNLYSVAKGPDLDGNGFGHLDACITPDGVLLREALLNGDRTKVHVMSEATEVSRGPIPPGSFEPPAS